MNYEIFKKLYDNIEFLRKNYEDSSCEFIGNMDYRPVSKSMKKITKTLRNKLKQFNIYV